jgi:hypothetical protein
MLSAFQKSRRVTYAQNGCSQNVFAHLQALKTNTLIFEKKKQFNSKLKVHGQNFSGFSATRKLPNFSISLIPVTFLNHKALVYFFCIQIIIFAKIYMLKRLNSD